MDTEYFDLQEQLPYILYEYDVYADMGYTDLEGLDSLIKPRVSKTCNPSNNTV